MQVEALPAQSRGQPQQPAQPRAALLVAGLAALLFCGPPRDDVRAWLTGP